MKSLLLVACLLSLTSSSTLAAGVPPLVNHGDPNAPRLWKELARLERGESRDPVRILQLGDSHTAGDYFSGELRARLQARFGNAGFGWVTPGYVNNQRSSQMIFRPGGRWTLWNSRTTSGDYPLGGFVNTAGAGAYLELGLKKAPAEGLWRVTAWLKPTSSEPNPWMLDMPSGEQRALGSTEKPGQWAMASAMIDAAEIDRLRLYAQGPQADLGGLVLDRLAAGVTVDALGINGSQVDVIRRWNVEALQQQLAWRQPDLIMLAYGTNEAFNPKFDAGQYANELRSVIHLLRQVAPKAALLLVGVPASEKRRAPAADVGCGVPVAPALMAVQKIQRTVAADEKTLYWDWMAVMGGACGAGAWAHTNPPLIGRDGVHYTKEGYVAAGAALYDALMGAYEAGR